MSEATEQKIRIWDAPVRVFHWLLVLSFAGAYLTSESEVWRLVHVTLGYTLGGLLVFRLVWGVVGTRYARFGNFVRGPAAVVRYLQSLRGGRPEHHLGHNPAGAVAIVLLMALGLLIAATGYVTYNELGPGWLVEVHELAANAMLLVIAGHLVGVVTASLQHRENLVRSMVTGFKTGQPEQGIRSIWRSVAVAIVLVVLGFWWMQWKSAPQPEAQAIESASTQTSK
ncbi:cytochrome B [Rhodoferax lacus]|uniref:Cytochrome B n=1 Tax=Rhodoferax lacus TaxID=2184758 RepID=A0A3E1R7K4_9BURK|nr:cytochrome b/b6 domain-containing protein [Rhodoferax lacus]RFO95358.1 cytochrome B [Rhodoferax lacus]